MPRTDKGHTLVPYTRSMAGTAQLVPWMTCTAKASFSLHRSMSSIFRLKRSNSFGTA